MNVPRKTLIALVVVVTLSFAIDLMGRVDRNFPLSISSQPLSTVNAAASSSDLMSSHVIGGMSKGVLAVVLCTVLGGVFAAVASGRRKFVQSASPVMLTALTREMIYRSSAQETKMTLLATRGGLVLATWEPLPSVGSQGLPLEDLSNTTQRMDALPYVLQHNAAPN